jgi:hypothetical protein
MTSVDYVRQKGECVFVVAVKDTAEQFGKAACLHLAMA